MALTHASLLIKIVVLTQWVLTVWSAMSPYFLATTGYCYMNLFILGLGIWAVSCQESTDAVLMYLIANLISIILDIVFVSIYHPRSTAEYSRSDSVKNEFRFSLGFQRTTVATFIKITMFISLLILKPLICIILFRIYSDRGGDAGDFRIPGIPNFSAPSNPQYEDIDKPTPSSQSPVETATPHQSLQTHIDPRY